MESGERRSRSEEKGTPLLRELILPNTRERCWPVIFPDGRIFLILIKDKQGLHLSEIDPDSGQLFREEKLSDEVYSQHPSVTTFFKNKIVLSFEADVDLTLIINIDTFRIEQRLDFIIQSIDALGDKSRCVVTRLNDGLDKQPYIANTATLGTVIVDLTPPSMFASSACVLADNELAILTTPSRYANYTTQPISGLITIWEEKKPDEWIAHRSATIEVLGHTALTKLNETQIIQISMIKNETGELDPLNTSKNRYGRMNYSLFSIIDKHRLTCHRIASFNSGAGYLPHKFHMFGFNTFLQRYGDNFFSIEVTSQGLRAKRFDLQFKRPDEHHHYDSEYIGFTLLNNGRIVFFRTMSDYLDTSELDPRQYGFIYSGIAQFNFFDLAPYRLSKDTIAIQNILAPVLPTVLSKIIADYCAGDFPLVIERNDSLIPGTAPSATPSRAPEDKGASSRSSTFFTINQRQKAAPPKAAERVSLPTTATTIPSSIANTVRPSEKVEDVITLTVLKKEIHSVLNRLIHEINFLRSKRDKSCFAFFINFELSTKSRKRAALESLMATSSYEQLYDQAETLLRDRSTRIHRAGTNTVTHGKGRSRTTELLLRIVSGPFGTAERRPAQNDFGSRV